jgi:hypothetical protein
VSGPAQVGPIGRSRAEVEVVLMPFKLAVDGSVLSSYMDKLAVHGPIVCLLHDLANGW